MARYIDVEALYKRLIDNDVPYRADVADAIDHTPTADVRENVKAHWEDEWHIVFHVYLPKCSSCGGHSPLLYKFCPNCGAVMDERSEDAEIH